MRTLRGASENSQQNKLRPMHQQKGPLEIIWKVEMRAKVAGEQLNPVNAWKKREKRRLKLRMTAERGIHIQGSTA